MFWSWSRLRKAIWFSESSRKTLCDSASLSFRQMSLKSVWIQTTSAAKWTSYSMAPIKMKILQLVVASVSKPKTNLLESSSWLKDSWCIRSATTSCRRLSWWWTPAWGTKSLSQYSCSQAVCGRRSTVQKCFRSYKNNTHTFLLLILFSLCLTNIRAHKRPSLSKGVTGLHSRQNMWANKNPPSRRAPTRACWTPIVRTLCSELLLRSCGKADSETIVYLVCVTNSVQCHESIRAL